MGCIILSLVLFFCFYLVKYIVIVTLKKRSKMDMKKYSINQIVDGVKKVGGVVIGSFIFAYAVNVLYVPFGFLSTGFNGISMMLNYLLGWPISICSYVLNIIFVVFGYKLVNRKFAFLSVVGITANSFFLDMTTGWTMQVEDTMVAVVFGGLILGIGVGIALRSGGALGGMNILGKIMNKYFGISIGTVDICFNLVIVVVAGILFDVNMAMYTIMARFVATKALDAINEGFNRTKTVIIISDQAKSISKQLINSIGRGVTFIKSEGVYTGDDKNMIYCVVRLTQLGKLKELVRKEDERVFMSILDTKEVYGKGFS